MTVALTPVASACAAALAPLVGQRFRKIGRAGLVWLLFGEPREVRQRSGGTRMVNRYALHLQCPFRLRDASAVLLASSDRYAASQDPEATGDDDDVDPIGASWFDAQAAPLNERLEREDVTVRAIETDPVGGFRALFDHGLVLDVLPATSFLREHWRFFERGDDGMHFVLFETDPSRQPPPPLQ